MQVKNHISYLQIHDQMSCYDSWIERVGLGINVSCSDPQDNEMLWHGTIQGVVRNKNLDKFIFIIFSGSGPRDNEMLWQRNIQEVVRIKEQPPIMAMLIGLPTFQHKDIKEGKQRLRPLERSFIVIV